MRTLQHVTAASLASCIARRPALRRLVQGWLLYAQQVIASARDHVGLLMTTFALALRAEHWPVYSTSTVGF